MNKTILITGSSRGIGRALALALNRQDLNIVINYKKEDGLAQEVVDSIRSKGINAIKIKADVGDFNQVKKMFEKIGDVFGPVDILINNAGIASIRFAQDVSIEEWTEIFNTNVNGVFYCTKLALEDMLKKKDGIIINLSSIWGQIGGALESHYSATKGAIISYTKALAKELGPSNIRVNAIAPGGVNTDMLKEVSPEALEAYCQEVPLGRLAEAEEVASLIKYLVSPEARYITGQVIAINGGIV